MISLHFFAIKRSLFLLLLFSLCLCEANAQNPGRMKVTGRVTDSKGSLLPGVSVIETGTSNGTTTDDLGTYTIQVSNKNASLTFTYVGFKERRASVKSNGLLDVALEEITTENEKVVVVGYSTQKKASVVGAISTIEPQKLQLSPSRSLSNNLAGMISGVLAVQRSGDPVQSNSDFWIRGISTFGANSRPLVLVDGIERSLNDIDPEEIESFSVLKDASASAVYGVRGANGVIMITTKRGKIGSPKVTARVERAITSPSKMPEYVGSVKFLEVMNEAYTNSRLGAPYSQDLLNKYRNKTDPELYPDINWWDVATRDHADNLRVNANVNGGTNFLRYALELGYFDETGMIERDTRQEWNSTQRVKRYNIRSNVDVNLTRTTLLRLSVGGFLQAEKGPRASTDDIFNRATKTPPHLFPPVYADGKIPKVQFKDNPWAFATQRGYATYNRQKLESTVSLEQDLNFVKGLKAKAVFAFDKYSGTGVNRFKDPDYYNPAGSRDANGKLILTLQSNGQQFLDWSRNSDWGNQSVYMETQLSFNRLFSGKHNVNGLLLYNQRNYDIGETLPFRNNGIAGRASYTYDRRYIAEFNFGYNGSENFAPDKRYGFFPAIAAGWMISEEKFMESLKSTISTLKLRGSWGEAGNSDVGGRRFAYLSTIDWSGEYRYGDLSHYFRAGRAEGEVGVPGLTWETVAKSNIGLEVGLWQNAFTFQADLFKDKRRDIFMQRGNVPASAGFSRAIWANYGKVDNQGIDMSLNGNKKITKHLSISVLSNFTYAHNKIIEMDEAAGVIGTPRSKTGQPVNQLFGFIAERLFTAEDFEPGGALKNGVAKQSWNSKVYPGDIKYKDLDNDGFIGEKDRTAIGGTRDPQIVYGGGLTVNYKGFDFGFFLQGAAKTDEILDAGLLLPTASTANEGNILPNIDSRWTIENPSQDVFWPRLSKDLNPNNTQSSTWWLRNMNFLRLRNLELGYALPSNLIKHAGMSNVRFFVRGSNLLTFSKFKLWDPELASSNGLKYPIMKTISAGINVNFL